MGSVHSNFENLGRNHNFTILSNVFLCTDAFSDAIFLLIHFRLMMYSNHKINIFHVESFPLFARCLTLFVEMYSILLYS